MTNILITGTALNKVANFIGYNASKVSLIEKLDLEKLIELRVLELFKRYDISEISPVEVCFKKGNLVIISGRNLIYTNLFFKKIKIEKKTIFPKYRLPPKE